MSARTRRGLALSWSALFVLSLLLQYFTFALAPSALAVHNDGLFELDKNATTQTTHDWDQVYADSVNHTTTSGSNHIEFVTDAVNSTPDEHLFTTGGSKDPNDISQWRWTSGPGVQDKNDIEHAYAAAYTNPTDGHRIVYFGQDRYAQNGDAFVGFWFLTNGVSEKANGTFNGVHADGDVLVQVNFTNGGVISTFLVSEWLNGALHSVTDGVDCSLASTSANDNVCGVVNDSEINSPWSYTPKAGTADKIPAGGFFEAGIDLTHYGLASSCFSTFISETRSSQPLTSTLSDYAMGGFSFCSPPTIETTSSTAAADFGASVTDTATLTGTGAASGTVKFFVCGPAAAKPDCSTDGTQVGNPVNVTTNSGGGTATSPAYQVGVTSAASGWYCWRAEYTAGPNALYLDGSHTDKNTECFYVAPATIEIHKVANPVGPVSAGADIGFDITVHNNGTQTTLGASMTDPLPAGIVWSLGTVTGGASCAIDTAPNPDVLTCTKASLAADASFTVHISGPTDASNCGTVSNSAHVATTNDGTGDATASVVVQCPDVKVVKTPKGGSVTAGGDAVFTIVTSNSSAAGTGTARDVTLTDNLPAGYTWTLGGADASFCSINTVPNPDVLSCNFGDLVPGASRTITLTATTSGANCAVIPNTAVVDASNEPNTAQYTANDTDSGSINVLCAQVGIAKHANPVGPVNAGDDIGFDIVVTNSGDGAASNVNVTDNLPTGIAWTADAPTGTASATCAIDPTLPLPDVLSCHATTMAAGSSFTVHIHGTTHAADCGTVTNTASVTSGNDGSGQASASVVVQCPDLQVVKTGNGPLSAGDPATFTIVLTNLGPGAAKNVTLSDQLPSGTWTVGVVGANATACSVDTSNLLTCHFGGVAAPPTGNTRTVTLTKTTVAAECPSIHNDVTVAATNEPSTALANNSSSADIVVNCPDVHVLKTADNGTISAGQTAAFTIVVSNDGLGTAKTVTLHDVLPSGVAWAISPAVTGCAIVSNVLDCSFASLAPASPVTIHISGLTDKLDCAGLDNTAVVAAVNEPVADQGDNSSHAFITVQCPDLEVLKTADNGTISAGDVAAFTIVVSNHGPGLALNVHVADTLPAGVTWAINPSVAGCGIVGSALTCDFASLASGGSVTIHVSGETTAANCGTLHNVVNVSATNENTDTDQFSNTASADITVNCPTIVLTKTADHATISAGDPIGFTIMVKNNGLGNATGVHVTDNLPGGITWTADAPTGTATATCSIAAGVLTCDSALMIGGATFSVHIHGTTTSANCGVVNNSAVVTTGNDGGDDDSSQVTVQCPDITVVKTPDGGNVNAGDNAIFTIVVSNASAEGTGTAHNVTLTDNLPAGYTWALGGANAASCSIDTVPNPDVLSCNFGDLAPGASRTITLTARTSGANCDAIPNLASVAASNEAAAQQGNNSDSGSINVKCANIAIAKVANPVGPINAGETAGFDITVHNTGAGIATGVAVTDNLPAGIDWTLGAITGNTTGVACAISGAVGSEALTCTDASLGSDGSFAVHVSGPTDAADCGTIPNTASVVTSNDGSGNATASVVVRCPDIQVVKDAPNTPIPVGQDLVYTITTTNIGTGTAKAVVLTDTLPAGFSWSVDNAKCSIAAGVLTCNFGDLAPAASVKITLTAPTSADPSDGNVDCSQSLVHQIPNVASATATNEGANVLANNTDGASITVLCSALQIQKSFTGNTGGTDPDLHVPSAKIGDILHYSLVYTGAGPLNNAVITDTLPQGLGYVDGSASGNADFNPGVYDSATRTITWHAKGTLPDPASGTVTYDVTVLTTAPEFAQPLVNVATIKSDETPLDQATASAAVLPPPLAIQATPPPTDTLTPETGASNPGFTLMLILLGVAGLALGIGFVTPTPERVRRRDRLG